MAGGPVRKTRKKSWLERLGLQAAPDPEEWVLASSGRIDANTGDSRAAAEAARALSQAGIEAQQKRYVLPDNAGFNQAAGGFTPSVTDRIRVGVLVHRRDLEQAKEVLGRGDREPEPTDEETSSRGARS